MHSQNQERKVLWLVEPTAACRLSLHHWSLEDCFRSDCHSRIHFENVLGWEDEAQRDGLPRHRLAAVCWRKPQMEQSWCLHSWLLFQGVLTRGIGLARLSFLWYRLTKAFFKSLQVTFLRTSLPGFGVIFTLAARFPAVRANWGFVALQLLRSAIQASHRHIE